MVNIYLYLFISVNLIISKNPDWKLLTSGLNITFIPLNQHGTESANAITVLRIDPHVWELVFMGSSITSENEAMTAHEWCRDYHLVAAINAGMFDLDNKTHVGYLKYKDYVNNSHLNIYRSVVSFNPKRNSDIPPYTISDLDENGTSLKSILEDYNSAIQNLRLIKKPGINVWQQQAGKWSEAALGEDNKGNILFIFSRQPFSMHDMNEILLNSGIGVVAAQHLEGGPEAQLYINTGNFEVEQFGSFETSYNENDDNNSPVPIPNILGIRQKNK